MILSGGSGVSSVNWSTRLFVLLGLLVLIGGFDFLFSSGETSQGMDSTSNPKRLLSLLLVYGVALVVVLLQPTRQAVSLALNPIVLLVVGLPLVSVLWSLDPSLSIKRAAAHALTIVFLLMIASRLTLEEFCRALLIGVTLTALLSLALVVAAPGIGVAQTGSNAGAWQGSLLHKSNLGRVCVMGLVVALCFPRSGVTSDRWIRIVCASCCSVLLIGTQSRVAWMTIGVALLVTVVFKAIQLRTIDLWIRLSVLLVGLVCFSGLVFLFLEDTIAVAGRDLTFTGRSSLWAAAISAARDQHPVLGAGFGAFWFDGNVEAIWYHILHWQGVPSHGHNGYLDAWLEMGWLGVVSLVVLVPVMTFTILCRLRDAEQGGYWFVLLVLHISFLSINMAGTISFKHSEIFWVCFLAPLFFRHQSAASIQLRFT